MCAGGKDGYVGRDGRVPEGEQDSARAMHDLAAARRRPEAGVAGAPDGGLRVQPRLSIPLEEVKLRTSRSSGPGGQHANVTASRVEAVFDVDASRSLSESQRERLLRRAGPRVVAVAQDARSQARNRELALERLRERIAAGLRQPRGQAAHAADPRLGRAAADGQAAGLRSARSPAVPRAATRTASDRDGRAPRGAPRVGPRPGGDPGLRHAGRRSPGRPAPARAAGAARRRGARLRPLPPPARRRSGCGAGPAAPAPS